MQKRLLYVSRLNSFTSDDTGEVVKGGRIAICDVEPTYTDSGYGCYTDIIWVNESILNGLRSNPKCKDLPSIVEVVLENRGLKSKPVVTDVKFVD